MTPAIRPMMAEDVTLTNAQGAVIATSPARAPLTVMLKSGLPSMIQAINVELIIAMQQARLVVIAMWAIARGSAAIVLPGLNPNHPNQRISPPRNTSAMLWPGIV